LDSCHEDEDGSVCTSPEAQQQRRRRHLRPLCRGAREGQAKPDMAELLSKEELLHAVTVEKLKNGKQ